MMKKFLICIPVLFCSLHLRAQQAVLYLTDTVKEKDIDLKCGTSIKVITSNDQKKIGKLDSIMGDAIVVSNDTILFSEIRIIKYRARNREMLNAEAGFGVLGLAVSAVLLGVATSMDNNGGDGSNVGNKGVILLLISTGLIVHSGIEHVIWHRKRVGDRWYLHARME